MKNYKCNRDSSIELLRVIACLIVIGVHIKLSNFDQNQNLDLDRLFISCLLGDGVALFWLISGFFFFSSGNFSKKIKSLFLHIIFPTVCYILTAQILEPWIANQCSFIDCLTLERINLWNILSGFLAQNTGLFTFGAHLWYVLIYSIIIFMYPMLKCICNTDSLYVNKARHYIILVSLILLLISDMQRVFTFLIPVSSFKFVESYTLFIIIGYELNLHKEKIKSCKYLWLIGISSFVLLNIVRMFCQKYLFSQDISNDYFVYYYSIFGFACSIFLFCGIYSIEIKHYTINRIVCFLGRHTFGIYLIHILFFNKLNNLGFQEYLYNLNRGDNGRFFNHLLFTIQYDIIIFILSLICTAIIQAIYRKLLYFIKNYRTRRLSK